MELRIYSPQLEFLGILDEFGSLIWERLFFEAGNFEITAPATCENINLLSVGNYLSKRGSSEVGIIEEANNKGNDLAAQITRRGRFLSSVLNRRVVRGLYNFSGTFEFAMYDLVHKVNSVPRLKIGSAQGFSGDVTFQFANKNLYGTLVKLAWASGIGFIISADFIHKNFTFAAYQPADRTLQNNGQNKIVFSDTRDNITGLDYTINNSIYKNFAYVDGKNGVSAIVDKSAEDDKFEMFVDGNGVDDRGLSSAEYKAALTQLGREKLNENAVIETFDVTISPECGYVYKTDYDLGDIVWVRHKVWNLSRKNRITRITEVYENGANRLELEIGSPVLVKLDLSGGE